MKKLISFCKRCVWVLSGFLGLTAIVFIFLIHVPFALFKWRPGLDFMFSVAQTIYRWDRKVDAWVER